MEETDLELLNRFRASRSDEAFSAIVRRYIGLVQGAAFRQVRSPELAEEVAQSVFIDLARNAGRLNGKTGLAAWLYQVTRRTAIDVVRRESRRQRREQEACQRMDNHTPADEWEPIASRLDEAMESLSRSFPEHKRNDNLLF